MKIEGSAVILTGASTGIGNAIAHRLAQKGAKIALANRSAPAGEKLLKELKEKYGLTENQVFFCATDVSKPSDVRALYEATIKTFGTYDIVINNAGYGGKPLIDEIEAETDTWIDSLNANYTGAMLLARLSMSHWAKNRKTGVIINSGSTASFGLHMDLSYSVAKSGLNFATQSITAMLERAVNPAIANCARVNTLAIGIVFTDAFARRFKDEEAVMRDGWWGRIAASFGGFTSSGWSEQARLEIQPVYLEDLLTRDTFWLPVELMVDRYINIIQDDSVKGQVQVVLGKDLLIAPGAEPNAYTLPMQRLPPRKVKAKV